MNIVVLLKQVPDTESVIEISDTGKSIETDEIKWVINPYDEYSIEEALLIRENSDDATVTVLTAGAEQCDEAIKVAYALGADQGIRIDTEELPPLDSLGTASLLTAALKKIPHDLIICGQRAVDDDNYQVPAAVAEALNLPLITTITRQEMSDGTINCDQAIEGGTAVVEAALPAVLTTQKGINEPRYPNMRAMMKARKREVEVMTLDDLGLSADQLAEEAGRVKVLSFTYPPERGQGRIIEGSTPAEKAAELVKLLREEAEVI